MADEKKDPKKGPKNDTEKAVERKPTEAPAVADPAPTADSSLAKSGGVAFDAAALATLADDQLDEMADNTGGTFTDVWTVIKDKGVLVGKPFFILGVEFKDDGDFGGPYVSVRGKTMTVGRQEGYCFVFTDGGAGVNRQLRDLANASPGKKLTYPIKCAKGLRASNYKYKDDDGNDKPSTTYYLDGSKA